MVDQNKIILMSKMARYEKRYMKKDIRITDYYVEDYVALNNFITRLGISLITVFFISLGAFKVLLEEIVFPTSIEQFLNVYIKGYIGPWLIWIVIYTLISSFVFGARHRMASKRMNEYKELIRELKKCEGKKVNNEGAADEI